MICIISKDVTVGASEVAQYEEMDGKAKFLLVSFISDEYFACIQENSNEL